MIQKLYKIAVNSSIFAILAFASLLGLAVPTSAQDLDGSVRCGSNINLNGTGAACDKDSLKKAGQTNSSRIENVIKTVINILSAIVGAVSVIMIVIGGFKYVTSNGDSNNVSSAKNTILYALVGLMIVAFAQVIVQFVLERST